jgi:hypothetical protein
MFSKVHRLFFLYLFRDFDQGTLDVGLEITTLFRPEGGKILCRTTTVNVKGTSRKDFVVSESDRSVMGLPGRYICYWNGGRETELIYERLYKKEGPRSYVHKSSRARSEIIYDQDGFEKRAENLVFAPRRYHEKFIRLLRL